MLEVSSNIVDLEKQLTDMGAAAADLTDVWTKIGTWWQARELTVFKTANRGQWPMLDPDTKKMRRSEILVRTGKLRTAVSNPTPIYSSPSTARFGAGGSKAFYGLFHQRGTGVPQRQPVPPLINSEIQEILQIIADHIMEAGKR